MTSLALALRRDLAALAWRQWTALGVTGWTVEEQRPVDPEALIVLTARLDGVDARLRDAATDWCVEAGHLVNGARLAQIVREIGGGDAHVPRFLATVRAAGGPAWMKLDARPRSNYEPRGKVHLTHLATPGRSVLRLRALFGVNARADILAVLLGAEEPVPLTELARRTRFARANVDRIVRVLALGGLVRVIAPGPRDTRVQLERDAPLVSWLGPSQRFPDWVSRFGIAARVLGFLDAWDEVPRPALGVEARRLVSELAPSLGMAGLPVPNERLVGDAYLTEFERWSTTLGRSL